MHQPVKNHLENSLQNCRKDSRQTTCFAKREERALFLTGKTLAGNPYQKPFGELAWPGKEYAKKITPTFFQRAVRNLKILFILNIFRR